MNEIQKYALHLLVIVGFIIVSVIYFSPILDGKDLVQGDNINAAGMSQEITKYQEETGEYSAWTNSMFGGMPSYQIKSPDTFNIHLLLQRFLHLKLPYSTMAIFFVYLLGFYLLLSSLGFNKGISIIGAFAFALSSYNIIIIAAGHITKCYAIAYMAPVLAGIIHCYNKNYIKGFFLTTFALGIEIACNHPQILYYLALLCGVYFVWKAVEAYMNKGTVKDDETALKSVGKETIKKDKITLKSFGKATAVVAVACIFAVLPNITNLWTTWEYGKYSTRSQSELSSKQNSSGLDKDYAMAWSYGIGESFNIMIPNFKGGESGLLGNDAVAMKAVADNNIREAVAQNNHYWGDQPFTSGPVYMGAIIVFLFVLGMFIVQNSAKWWILAATIISLVMSWGNNFGFVTDLLFNYFPLYNKFRSVSMALVIAQVCVPFLAMIALHEISQNPEIIKKKSVGVYISLGLTAGLCLLFYLMPSLSGSFLSSKETIQIAEAMNEQPRLADQYQLLATNIEIARKAILSSDAGRSLIFIVLSAVVIFLFYKLKWKPTILYVSLGLLIVLDLWNVDNRYLGSDDYQPANNVETILKPSNADEFIQKDNDPNFRVLNLTANVFNDGITSYFHKSIGGYHGAKMRRYQEFIDTILAPTVQYAQWLAQKEPNKLSAFLSSNNSLNMLNTKFVILDRNTMPYVNMNAYGNAWYVNKYELVENADQEISALKRSNPEQTAIINKNLFSDYMAQMPKEQIYGGDSSYIKLTKYQPNYISYDAVAYRDRLAVFSEIYYPKGWQAYLDGKEVEHVCADYILRAMVIPTGNHKIEFRFNPKSVKIGSLIATISSILIILGLLAYVARGLKTIKN